MSKKSLPNGRAKGDPKHIRLYCWETSSAAWKSLSMTSRCLLLELKMLYNSLNNGDLFLSVREAAKRLNISGGTAAKAFKELEDRGFVKANQKGSFQWKTRHATAWILTEYEYRGQLPTKDFMRWLPKEKTRHQNSTPTASNADTPAQSLTPTNTSTVSKSDTQNATALPMTVSSIDTQLVYHREGRA